ncbi:MAG TPA: sensor histidine kinase [Actinomycetota bacterium]|nr:sensor histidine kinase [Actinomycetota bacterium]
MSNRIMSAARLRPYRRQASPPAVRSHRYAAATARIAMAGVMSLAIATTGGTASPLVPVGVLVAAVLGLQAGIISGAVGGAVIVAASVPALAAETGEGLQALNQAATWLLLFPLAGTATGLVHALRTRPDASRERRRLAADLHDGVAQTLAHLRLELDMLSHPELGRVSDPERLARLARVADRTLTDVRALINDLAAPVPAGGLVAALREHVAGLEGASGPVVTLDAPASVRTPEGVDGQLLRIAQEALSNAMRHSGGTAVHVRLAAAGGGTVRLSVHDDGRGIAAEATTGGGLGLDTMRERARAIGATIEIGPRPGGGTRVEVTVPAADLTRSA